MKEFLKKDSTKRVLWTLLEGFIAGFVVTLKSASSYDETLIKSAFIAGFAGVISAFKTLIINKLEKMKGSV